MYTNILLPTTATVAKKLTKSALITPFYLSGGTGLALQLGHRESEDLDFFTKEQFDPLLLQNQLREIGKLESVELAEGTLNCYLDSVKLRFLHYSYQLLEPTIDWENMQVSSVIDIACTKVITISMRGSKKDFIDLYFLLEIFTIEELFAKVAEKYQGVDYNNQHLLKSLVYFEDAEQQPMPKMHKPVDWEQVKAVITNRIKSIKLF